MFIAEEIWKEKVEEAISSETLLPFRISLNFHGGSSLTLLWTPATSSWCSSWSLKFSSAYLFYICVFRCHRQFSKCVCGHQLKKINKCERKNCFLELQYAFTYMAALLTHNSVGQLANKDALDEIHTYTFLPIRCGKNTSHSVGKIHNVKWNGTLKKPFYYMFNPPHTQTQTQNQTHTHLISFTIPFTATRWDYCSWTPVRISKPFTWRLMSSSAVFSVGLLKAFRIPTFTLWKE